jgi:hypothetical protein
VRGAGTARRRGDTRVAKYETHQGATPRDVAASVGGSSGCAWRGRQGRPARGRGAQLAGARDVVAQRRPGPNVLPVPCLKLNNSKNLYKSAQNFEYESCRSQYHLQLSQRLYGAFLIRFCTTSLSTLNANHFQ